MPPGDFVDNFVNDSSSLIDGATSSILGTFGPYTGDTYNSLELNITPIPPNRIVVPPPVAPEEPIQYIDRRTNVDGIIEGSMFTHQGSDFWFKGLSSDLDWSKIDESSITLNKDLLQYITPYSPAISGVWRPALLYVNPFNDEKNTNIEYSYSGKETPCEAGLGIENFITISDPVFKTWTLDTDVKLKIDWSMDKDIQTCSTMGVLFWYRHYDIGRDTTTKTIVITEPTNQQGQIQSSIIRETTVQIDNKTITLKAQHSNNQYNLPSTQTTILYGLSTKINDVATNFIEDEHVIVKKQTSQGKVISEDIYKVTKGLWICLGPKRFIPGVDIYMPNGLFSIDYLSNSLVEDIKKNNPPVEPRIEYYPVANLIIDDESKYRGVLTSLLNLSNDTTLENIMNTDGINSSITPPRIYGNKESRNKYIALKNLAKFLATGPLSDMVTVYAYNKFSKGLDLSLYATNAAQNNINTKLKPMLENIYGNLTNITVSYTQDIFDDSKKHQLKDGFYSSDELTISFTTVEAPSIITATINKLDQSGSNSSVYNWQTIDEDSSTIQLNNLPTFKKASITVSKNILYYPTDANPTTSNNLFQRESFSLYKSLEDNNIQSIEDNLKIIKTKKDLAKAIVMNSKNKKNFYLEFPANKKTKIKSSKTITVPHVYIKLDFENKRRIGVETTDFWYKQRFNVGGTDFYTKLKVPDDTDFGPGENESLVLSITDREYNKIQSSEKKIIIFDFVSFDSNLNEFYNSSLTSLYDAFGVNQQFYEILDTQKTLNTSLRNGSETYNLGLINNENYKISKRLNDFTYDFDKALRSKYGLIKNLNENNKTFQDSIDLLNERFAEINTNQKTFYPDIKEIYFHRFGGILIPNSLLFTIGESLYWNYHTGPIPIAGTQYFIDTVPPSTVTRPDKVLIEFECNANLHIRLYDIEIENLRNNDYESSGYRPFPNKVAVRSDETRVYDKIIGYEYNENKYLLTTQFSPPIVAYGGHRKETVEALGVEILNHPSPIEKATRGALSGLYVISPSSTLPFTAKNPIYRTQNITERNQEIQALGVGQARDKSSVKCFLTPQYFYNEITFRKGFFHPNIGWLDHSVLTGSSTELEISDLSILKQRTPVIASGVSNCKTYGYKGTKFSPKLITKALAEKEKDCGDSPLTGDNLLTILDPEVEYNNSRLMQYRVYPNLVTVNVDNNIDFISLMSAKLLSLNHPFPKDLKIGLFDPRQYRFIAGNIVTKTIDYDIKTRRCANAPPAELEKLENLKTKEKNSWIGPLGLLPSTSPVYLLSNSTLLNYKSNFNLSFNNYGKSLKYAFHNDTVLPEDSLDYYIGSSGIVKGFGKFDLDSTLISDESDNTWGIQISDMGGLDSGSTCFQLQVCTGCPVPNYDTITGSTGISIIPYNILAYNNQTFYSSGIYPSGYTFIADFTDKKHLIPPVNLEAPYDISYKDNSNFPCDPEPDSPFPREFIKPTPEPIPVFIPPITFPLIGLLVQMSIMSEMASMGYDMPYGAFGGVYTPNPFTENVSLKARNQAYLENKGYLQVEGTTASYLRGAGFTRGLSLSKNYKYGIPNKVELEIQYKNCLWYTLEADIFKYSPQCSPVLSNTKFKYLVYDKHTNYPGFDYTCELINIVENGQTIENLIFDGARPFYSFSKNEPIKLVYDVLRKNIISNNLETVRLSGDFTIDNLRVVSYNNPQYVASTIDENDTPVTNTDADSRFLPGSITVMKLSSTIINNDDKFIKGTIEKVKKNTMLLYSSTETENDEIVPFGKWSNSEKLNSGSFVCQSIKDQVFSEGSYGWGSSKINPKITPIFNTPKLLSLHNFDYHYGKSDYCGKVKLTRNNNNKKIITIKYDPRIKYSGMISNPYAQSIDNQYIKYTGYPSDITNIKNKIYSHNIFSISNQNRKLYDFKVDNSSYFYDKSITEYYLPYYDLTLDPDLLSGFFDQPDALNHIVIPSGQELPDTGVVNTYYKYELSDEIYRWNSDKIKYENVGELELRDRDYMLEKQVSSSGIIEFENIFSHTPVYSGSNTLQPLLYNDNYYWISIPHDASGVLASSSKIPYSIKQECDYLGNSWASTACQNVCNTQMIGPLKPEDISNNNVSYSSQDLSMFYIESHKDKCPQTDYELRETTQSFYMGCGEFNNDSLVRMDLAFRYYVPKEAHAYISAKELLENNDNIKVRFKYIPRKIQTDFTMSFGQNIVNQSQLYFWECHETNIRNFYTEKTRINKTPPFFQVLNEMIYRAWFGERQKISTQDTFGVDTFITQNHYKWVPYEYDNTDIFNSERKIL